MARRRAAALPGQLSLACHAPSRVSAVQSSLKVHAAHRRSGNLSTAPAKQNPFVRAEVRCKSSLCMGHCCAAAPVSHVGRAREGCAGSAGLAQVQGGSARGSGRWRQAHAGTPVAPLHVHNACWRHHLTHEHLGRRMRHWQRPSRACGWRCPTACARRAGRRGLPNRRTRPSRTPHPSGLSSLLILAVHPRVSRPGVLRCGLAAAPVDLS